MNRFKTLFCFSIFTFTFLILPSFALAATPTAESKCAAMYKKNTKEYSECINDENEIVCKTWNTSYLKKLNVCETDNVTAYEECYESVKSKLNSEISSLKKSYSTCAAENCVAIKDESGYNKCMKNNCPNSSYQDQSACLSSAYSFVSSRHSSSIKEKNEISVSGNYEINYSASPCANESMANAVKVVGKIVSIIQIVVPILLVIMAMVDITKSIVSSDDNKSRKSISTLIKRLISAVLVFFVIAIIKLVCQLIGDNTFDSCLSLIAKPW